jgi:hypothetical protein
MFLLCCFTQDLLVYVLQNGIMWVYQLYTLNIFFMETLHMMVI